MENKISSTTTRSHHLLTLSLQFLLTPTTPQIPTYGIVLLLKQNDNNKYNSSTNTIHFRNYCWHHQYCPFILKQREDTAPIQSGGDIGIGNYLGNEHPPTNSRPIKRFREQEPVNMPQNLGVSLDNNVYQNGHGHIGAHLNPTPVSTGLGLFVDKKERCSSVNSTCEDMKNKPGLLSLGNGIKMEMDRQTEEFCQYFKHQEELFLKGGRELNQRHTFSLLNALEKAVNKKMHEKELQIENINRKNKELEDRIKQVTMESQSWHNRAKYNESVANVLKTNIHQIMAQGSAQGREGFGDSEVDDAVSCMDRPEIIGNRESENQRLKCRGCKRKQVAVLLFPCRHLCLCADCEGLVEVCPVCQVMKTASFLVNM